MQNFIRSQKTWIVLAFILLAGTLTYLNSFNGTYVFDDERHILYNPSIRSLWPPWPSMFNDLNISRPIVGYSFAVNYAMTGYDTFSYHLFNLLFHLFAAMALFGVVRRLCKSPHTPQWCQDYALEIAATSTLLWIVHPLNLQSVTYLTQRFQSMMAMFYLLTVYCAIRLFENQGSKIKWLTLTTLFSICGMLCKQDMVTVPFTLLVIDRLFYSETFMKSFKQHRWMHLGQLFSLIILVLINQIGPERAFAGFGNNYVIPLNYAYTQMEVIMRYLGLSVMAFDNVFDYRYAPVTDFMQVWPQCLIIFSTLAVTLWFFFKKNSKASIFGLWFFFNLALTSTFFPIADSICEYRMYLPLAALTSLAAFGVWWFAANKKFPKYVAMAIILICTGVLGAKTHEENKIFYSQIDLWKDVIKKRPLNPRAYNNLGILYERDVKDVKTAHELYRKSYEVDKNYIGAAESMARIEIQSGNLEKAMFYLNEAIRISPHVANSYHQIGKIMAHKQRFDEAEKFYKKALELDPFYTEAYSSYGIILMVTNRAPQAIALFQTATQYDPQIPDYFFNLGTAYAMSGQLEAAKPPLFKALQLNPKHQGALLNLATLYIQQNHYDEARPVLLQAEQLYPENQSFKNLLRQIASVKN